jgi:hypothetical protein
VRGILRKEVNFGCPVKECGRPCLKFHHFDPPWEKQHHHNPEGMIALCAVHHDYADGHRYTNEQLRQMKENPFITKQSIRENYGYLRVNTVCNIGNLAYNVRNILEINGERAIGFEKDEDGFFRLNLLLRNSQGLEIFKMENSDWIANTGDLYDLNCTARGREITILSRDRQTQIRMRFEDFTQNEFQKKFVNDGWGVGTIQRFLSHIGSPQQIPVWSVSGWLRWKNRVITIQRSKIIERFDDGGTNVISGNTFINWPSAFSISEEEISVG